MVSIYQVLGNSFDSWTLITYTSLHKHYQFMTWLYAIWLFWLLQRVRHFIVWIVWKGRSCICCKSDLVLFNSDLKLWYEYEENI